MMKNSNQLQYQIIFWRDIPVQVRVKNGRFRQTYPLSPRFQQTVHRAAYRGKAITGDAYIEEWHPSPWQETAVTDAEVLVAQIETDYPDERLDKLARNKGIDPTETTAS